MSTLTKIKKRVLLIVGIVVALIAAMFAAATAVVAVNMNKEFGRGDYPDARLTLDYYYDHYKGRYPREEVRFMSGENELHGFIYGAENKHPSALLVFAHGIGCGHEDYLKELLWFVDKGWCVFTYDATGSGYSEGEGTMGLPQSALDLDAALTFVENDSRLNSKRIYLMGHSWGGYAVTAVLNFDHKIEAAASISGYAVPVEMIYEFSTDVVGSARPLIYPSIVLYNKLRFGEYAGLSAVDGINRSDTPVLILHGTNDSMIGYNESAIINKRDEITNPKVRYVTLENVTHTGMFYTKEAREYKSEFYEERNKHENISEEELIKLYDAADRELVNQPNEELLTQIEQFFGEVFLENFRVGG